MSPNVILSTRIAGQPDDVHVPKKKIGSQRDVELLFGSITMQEMRLAGASKLAL